MLGNTQFSYVAANHQMEHSVLENAHASQTNKPGLPVRYLPD